MQQILGSGLSYNPEVYPEGVSRMQRIGRPMRQKLASVFYAGWLVRARSRAMQHAIVGIASKAKLVR